MTFKRQQALRQILQGGEIVRCKGLSLENREIDFDLIEPTGVNGPMNEHQVAILGLKPSDRLGTSMRRTIVNNPEDPSGLAVGTLAHHLTDETVKGGDAIFAFAATEESGTMDIQSGEIGPGPESLVFVLDFHRLPRLCGQGRRFSGACLNAGLFIRTDDELVGAEFTTLPDALV